MTFKEKAAELYWVEHAEECRELLTKAYTEGYKKGFSRSLEIVIEGTHYYDLGLPSGTMWSSPVYVKHDWRYITYDLKNYNTVSELNIPTMDDFKELMSNCAIIANSHSVSKDIEIIGPNGNRINIGTKDYLNNPSNPNSVVCKRQGENTAPSTNMFWLKADPESNKASVGIVNFDDCSINTSSHFMGFKLPYLLVKRR